MRLFLALATAVLACALPQSAAAQEAPTSVVTTYRIASGQQVNFLKWLARQDQINAAAGIARSQLYVHSKGDSWDYLVIAPQPTAAQDVTVEAATRKMGLNPRRGGIELRQYVASHADTIATGPTSATAYLAWLGEK